MSTTTAAQPSRYEMPEPLIERTKLEIATRLRAVCAEMPAEEFDVLIEQMANVQIKYAPQAQR